MMIPREADFGAKQESSNCYDPKISTTAAATTSSWARLKDPRIVRVSRATGGKDRHSKVCTVRGLRDRRVRLSVPTAIQLYDLQERLGLNQPSKVVDWLLDAAKNEIDELPPLEMPQGITFTQMINPHHQGGLKITDQLRHLDKFKDVSNWTRGGSTTTHDHGMEVENHCNNQAGNYDFLSSRKIQPCSVSSSSSSSSSSSHVMSSSNAMGDYNVDNSFGRWDPNSNLTLSHTHTSLGLGSHQHEADFQHFQQHQVLVYHQAAQAQAQPYYISGALDMKGHPSFHTSEFLSSSNTSSTANVIRPFSFNMSTSSADLLPSPNDPTKRRRDLNSTTNS